MDLWGLYEWPKIGGFGRCFRTVSFWWIFSGGLAVSFGGCGDSLISPGALFHKENGGKTLGMEGPSCLGPSRWSPLKGDWDPINTR